MADDWLARLKDQLQTGDDFCAEMHSQLAALFETATGETLARFQLLPPLGKRFELEQDGKVSSVAGNLLNIDVIFPVRIAWTSQNSDYKFWWLELPSGKIRGELAGRRNINFGAEFSFELRIKDPVWPHIQLTLQAKPGFDAHRTEQIIRRRANAAEKVQDEGVVHRIGEIRKLGADRYQIQLDLGSTGLRFMIGLLKDLEACHVKKVTLDSWLGSSDP